MTKQQHIDKIAAAVAAAKTNWDGLDWPHAFVVGPDHEIEVDASIYGLTNLEDAAQLAEDVTEVIEDAGMDETSFTLREQVEDAIREAVEYRKKVEADSEEAAELADDALAAALRGDWDAAIKAAEEAARIESNYGDDPAYGDLADIIRDAQLADLKDVSGATDIHALRAMLSDEWYDAVEGEYRPYVPTWGPETASVLWQIGCSCADGDIVSWDTRDADPGKHLYLRRSWDQGHQHDQPEQLFRVVSGAKWRDLPITEGGIES